VRVVTADLPTFELEEWEPAVRLPGVELTTSDRTLALALSDGENLLAVDELRDGVRVRAFSWVGVVRFEHFEVRVVPKLVGGNLGILAMLDYASGLDALARLPSVRELAVERDGRLVDLLGLLLAMASERLIRDGLLQDYVTHEDTLTTVRGRLLPVEQLERHYGRIDRLECRYDELETDILENRIVAVALGLARRICHDDEAHRRLARVHAVFSDACETRDFEPEVATRELFYHRRNEHYRTAHTLAWYFIHRLAVTDVFAPGGGRSFAFLLDMNLLFEQFVTRILDDTFRGTAVSVHAQRRDRSLIFNEATGRPYAAVIPDVLLERRDENGRRRVPIDAKYKLYDERKIDPGDVYQTFFYAYAYSREPDRAAARSEAFVIYPESAASGGVRLRIQAQDGVGTARIRALPLNVEAALASIVAGQSRHLPALDPIRHTLETSSAPVALG
jgi:5-methylcytosine-specific restriction enzyme subunit McrC